MIKVIINGNKQWLKKRKKTKARKRKVKKARRKDNPF